MKRCNNQIYHGYVRVPSIEPLILTQVSPGFYELVAHVPNTDNVLSSDFSLQNILKLPNQDFKQANIDDNFESSSNKIHSALVDVEINHLQPVESSTPIDVPNEPNV